jgi:hypothetical protein
LMPNNPAAHLTPCARGSVKAQPPLPRTYGHITPILPANFFEQILEANR